MYQPRQQKCINWKLIVFLLGILWMLTFSNRMILSPLIGLLKEEWDLTAYETRLISSVIYLPYMIFQIPCGILADKWDRKSLLVYGGILQGISIIGCAFSSSIFNFNLAGTPHL